MSSEGSCNKEPNEREGAPPQWHRFSLDLKACGDFSDALLVVFLVDRQVFDFREKITLGRTHMKRIAVKVSHAVPITCRFFGMFDIVFDGISPSPHMVKSAGGTKL